MNIFKRKNSPKDDAIIPPSDMKRQILVKIIITNNSDENVTAELFNKNNGVNIGGGFEFKGLTGKVVISDKVITKVDGQEYEQTYAEFMESILDGGLIIMKIKTTDNSQFALFKKDTIRGKQQYTPEMMIDDVVELHGGSIMKINLMPKQEFEIEFEIVGEILKNRNYCHPEYL